MADEKQDDVLVALLQRAAEVPAAVQTEVRTIRLYAIDGSAERKQIEIPDGFDYYNHSIHVWTANPQGGNGSGDWKYTDGVVRAPAPSFRVLSVWAEVSAQTRDLFGARKWIGIDLSVVIAKKA